MDKISTNELIAKHYVHSICQFEECDHHLALIELSYILHWQYNSSSLQFKTELILEYIAFKFTFFFLQFRMYVVLIETKD